jgi:anti-sigma B factor antagonist
MTCGRCGLSLRLQGSPLNLDRCPRCFAFAGVSVPLRQRRSPMALGGTALLGAAPPIEPAGGESPHGTERSPTAFGYLIVSTQQHGSATVVTLHGKLDLASEHCFDKAIRRACQLCGERLVIDLTALEFLDGIGLKALLRARRSSLEHGKELVLVKGPPNVQRMFELTDTLDLFSFDD